jgi:hypothetical protein
MRRLRWGRTQGGVRWMSVSDATFGWISGTNWMADAPVPMTATRSPVRSWSWRQVAEWNIVPVNDSSPGRSGMAGSARGPLPRTTTSAVSGPVAVSRRQDAPPASHDADRTSAPKRVRATTPRSSAVRRR